MVSLSETLQGIEDEKTRTHCTRLVVSILGDAMIEAALKPDENPIHASIRTQILANLINTIRAAVPEADFNDPYTTEVEYTVKDQ